MKCRHCATELTQPFLDLGHAPPSNAYVTNSGLRAAETTFPLKLNVCHQCWLVQTEDYNCPSELFSADYAYFSSISASWLAHAAEFARSITARLGLKKSSFVVEVASNDGYLLKNFVAAGIPCLGIEPTNSTASAAEKIGVPTLRKFFGTETARSMVENGQSADLICGNNVYAHVPDINDFTSGLRIALKAGGTISLEFPHLMSLIKHNQFDTVYHEHFSYLSLIAVSRIFSSAGLRIFDVETIPTHGGSIRVYGCHDADVRATCPAVNAMLEQEQTFGLETLGLYEDFQVRADRVKNDFLSFLIEQKRAGKSVVGYGAAAKGNTLLNYAGVKADLCEFVCDAAESKQYKFLPGSHIPILPPLELARRKPDWVIIFPWNIAAEVRQQQKIEAWGGRFVVAIPQLTVLE